MKECSFSHQNLEELQHLLIQPGCNMKDFEACRTLPKGKKSKDPCVHACEIVQEYGNGFSFRNLMMRINQETGSEFTSCFPSGRYGKGASGLVLRISCSPNTKYFTHYAMKLLRRNIVNGSKFFVQ